MPAHDDPFQLIDLLGKCAHRHTWKRVLVYIKFVLFLTHHAATEHARGLSRSALHSGSHDKWPFSMQNAKAKVEKQIIEMKLKAILSFQIEIPDVAGVSRLMARNDAKLREETDFRFS